MKIMNLKSPMVASFFNKGEIFKLFKKFKIIKCFHNSEYELISNYKTSYWIIVAKNK